MSNPLYGQLNSGNNGLLNMVQNFNKFKQQYQGNAKEEVQKLLSSGKMNQQQFNQLQSMANQFQAMLGMMK